MGYYPEVKPGDKVKHYAQKENDLNAILSQHSRQGLTPSAGRAKRVMSNQCVITVMNNTASALKAMSAVSVDEAATPVGDTEDEIIVPVKQTTDTSKPFFLLQTTLETKGEIGTALVSGVTAAKVNISDLTHMYAVPDTSAGNAGKLISASDGTARIIWKSSATATGEILVLLQLGSAGGGEAKLELGILKSVPANGSGLGTYQKITVSNTGDFVESGTDLPVIIPRIFNYYTDDE